MNDIDTKSKIAIFKSEEFTKENSSIKSLNLSEIDILETIHALELHQLELELQNEELRQAKEQAESSAQKYAELYDFAPTAYFTLSNSAEIIDSNLFGSQMLGKERIQLKNSYLTTYISEENQRIFETFLKNIFLSRKKETCEVKLLIESKTSLFVHLTGMMTDKTDQCLMTAMDITEIKKMAELNQILLTSLPYAAMYIRQKDKVVLAANKIALDLGIKIGGQCWHEFKESEYLCEKSKKIAEKYPNGVPAEFEIQCSFCQADKCFIENSNQNNNEIHALGKIWDIYWIKINDEIFLHYAIDITERKQAEEEREFLISSIENSNNIVVVKDLNLRVVAANKGFLDVIGHDNIKSIIGKNDAELFGISAKSEPVRSYMEDDRRAQKMQKGEYILKEELLNLPNGDVITILTKKYPIFNNKGKLFCTGNVSIDITERKKSEEALLKSEQMLQSILEHFPGDVFWKNKQSIYMGCNQSFAEGFGFKSKAEIINKTDFDLGLSAKLAEAYRADDRKIIESGIEILHRTEKKNLKNGEKNWFDSSKLPLRDFDGNTIGIMGVFTNITKRKLAEESLIKSEEKYRKLIENSHDIIYIFNTKGIFTYVSSAWTLLLGHRVEQVVGKSIQQFIHKDDYQRSFDFLNKVVKYGERQETIEYRVQHKNGSWFWHSTSGVPLKDKYGEIIGIEGTASNITERKLAELKLRESEKNYRYLFANNPQPMWIIDYETLAFLEVNSAAVNHYGYSKVEFLGMKLGNIKLQKNTLAPFKKLNNEKQDYRITLEEKHKTKSGKIIYVEITSHAVDYEGKNARHILVNDVTERKLAEQDLKQLNEKLEDRVKERTSELQNSNISLKLAEEKFRTVADFTYGWEYWIGDDGKILYMSPSAEKVTGYTLEEFVNDPKLLDMIVYKNDKENWEEHKKMIYSSKKRHAEIIYRIEKKTGEIRWISSISRSVKINGKYMGIRVSNLNITQKIKAENALLKVTVDVEERERNRFSRELHDGLGPLLSTIKLYFQWLAETNDPEKIKIITQKGNANIESAIQSTREIARGLSTQNLNKFGFVDTITDFTQRLNDTKKIKINFITNTNDRFNNFLETSLYRISTELIKNTLTYAQASLVILDFKFIKEKNKILLTYTDNGIGFDLASTEKESKGMGVMNIQQRIKSLRGKFKIKTQVGKGIKVFIELPIDDI
ncbi:MAG: PAS domain S-box protein [Paludibacter sp.]